MNKRWFIVVLVFCVFDLNAQVSTDTIDSRYREDQLYMAFSYNLMNNKPDSDSSSLFSGGFNFGYILDIPMNERRNAGLGIGLGYSYNSYSSNFLMYLEEGLDIFETSRFTTHLVELPIELRWRTSTATKYSFWRVYTGAKFAYLFHSKSKFEFDGNTVIFSNIKAFDKFQYGLTFSAGYGSWNFHAYYGLSSLFNNIQVDGKNLDLKDFSLGLKFYIL